MLNLQHLTLIKFTDEGHIKLCMWQWYCHCNPGGTAVAAPPPFRPGNPALCGSRPLVTPYYCRLGDLLCFVFISAYCMFDLSVYYLFL